MKKLLQKAIVAVSMLTALLVPVLFIQAADYGTKAALDAANGGTQGTVLPEKVLNSDTLPGAIGAVVQIILGFLGIIFFGIVLYGGLIWMTAMGSSEKVDKAKSMIEGALIGLVIVLLAYALTKFIFTFFETGAIPS